MSIEYTILREDIKNVYISVKGNKVIVKAPRRLSKEKIDKLVLSKKDWIEKKLENKKEDRKIDLQNRNYIYILGNKVKVQYSYKNVKRTRVALDENQCQVVLPNGAVLDDTMYECIEKLLDRNLKQLATKYIIEAMEKYISLTNLKPERLSIRKFKSIWGNCSSKKEIKINQNIIWYTKKEIEYVCLHEIVHLKYMNHQKEFWDFVKKYMPDYKERILNLKQ